MEQIGSGLKLSARCFLIDTPPPENRYQHPTEGNDVHFGNAFRTLLLRGKDLPDTTVMHDGAIASQQQKCLRTGTRITVTVPPDHYEQNCSMAKGKKVSNAWIICCDVEKYIQTETSLFVPKKYSKL